MADSHSCHGQNGHEILDLPIGWDECAVRKDDHSDDTGQRERHAVFKLLQNFGDFDEEVGKLGFLGGGAPSHVNFEHVREKGTGNVKGETAKENAEHERPFEVHENCRSELVICCEQNFG